MKLRNNSIDLMRFIFALSIAAVHVCGVLSCGDYLKNARVIVECFFVMSGFFLFRTLRHHPDEDFIAFVRKKVARLWPVLFVVIFVLFLSGRLSFTRFFLDSLFLQCVGFIGDYKGIHWFVSPLFWSLLFYFGLSRAIRDERKRYLLVAVIVYWAYVLVLRGGDGSFGRGFTHGFISRAFMRGIGGVGLGYLLGALCEVWRCSSRFWATAAELFFSAVLFVNLFYVPLACSTHFVIVVSFAVLLILLDSGRVLLSKALDRRLFGVLGRYSYSIYMVQPLSLLVLDLVRSRTMFASQPVGLVVAEYVVFILLSGFALYHLVECPGAKLFESRKGP